MKNKSIAGLAIVAALLGGCAMHHRDHHHGKADHSKPLVTVKGDVVSISPEPLVFLRDERNVEIVWRLPAGLTFAENGIVIEGRVADSPKRYLAAGAPRATPDPKQDEIVCSGRSTDGQQFRCTNRNSRPGVYKYTIRVLRDGKPLTPFDPHVMNID